MDNDNKVVNKKIIGILISCIIAVVSESSICPNTLFQKIVFCILALLGVYYIIFFCKEKNSKKFVYTFLLFALPFVLASVYTVTYCLIKGDLYGLSLQSITTSIYIIVDVMVAVGVVFIWKYDSIKIVSDAVIISYFITLFMSVFRHGIGQLWLYITARNKYPDWYFSGDFERHDIGVAVVPIIVFLLSEIIYKDRWKNIEYWIRIALCMMILFLCGKRSAYMGLLVGIGLVTLYKVIKNKKYLLSCLIIGFSLFGSFMYVYLIKAGILHNIFDSLGINSMGRLAVYDWFSNQYKLSILYFGKGFQYIHRYMIMGLGSELVNKFGYLHNSILQIYIEIGFIGFWILFGIWLILNPFIIKRNIGKSTARFYICMIVSMIVICTVDNVMTYPLYQICMFIVVIQHANAEKDKYYEKDLFAN